jgi:hypothetical protein
MLSFVQRHCGSVIGVLSGFDRLLFRGTHRILATAKGMMNYLWEKQVPLTEFGKWSCELTEQVRADSEQAAEEAGRPVRYLNDSAVRKEELARQIAVEDGIERGLVCVLKAVEPCWSFEVHRDRASKKLVLQCLPRKCLHHYHYFMDEQFGLLHVRLQTWLPLGMRICLNGRAWLARQMDGAGIEYEQRDNCFVRIGDLAGAQRLLDEQLQTDWPAMLNRLAQSVFPRRGELLTFAGAPIEPYWSVDQSEWATDVMFNDAASLALVYPKLIRQGILTLGSSDVLKFLGKRPDGRIRDLSVSTDLKRRPEGVRLKHQVAGNSVKMYDKQGSVLRIETTINDPSRFQVYRGTEAKPDDQKWRQLRKGVADVHRRAEVSQAANDRYLSHLAEVDCPKTVREALTPLGRPVTRQGRRYRGLRPLTEDASLLEAVAKGEFAINGFRNADIRQAVFGKDGDKRLTRKRSGQISRKLALLRAHGLIRRVPRTRRWMLTDEGKSITTLLAATAHASVPTLLKNAA